VNQGGRVTDFGAAMSRMSTLPSPVTSVVFPSVSATSTLRPPLPEREALLIPELLDLDETHLSELRMSGFRACEVTGCTTCATRELEKPLQARARARRLSRRGRRQPREWYEVVYAVSGLGCGEARLIRWGAVSPLPLGEGWGG
jgi:hypothetical protein